MKILFLPEVAQYFLDLANTLYEKHYFGFEQSAIDYADSLFNEINEDLPTKHKKKAPPYFDRYGKSLLYATFKRNRNTTWYVFFHIYQNDQETIYFVRYITNNHTIAQYLV